MDLEAIWSETADHQIQGKVIDRLPGYGSPDRKILRADLAGGHKQRGLPLAAFH
jgi:hypothetical protein